GVYLLVLVASGITMSFGALAVIQSAAQREMQELSIDRQRATARAESALQLAVAALDDAGAWRSSVGGRLLGPISLERGEAWVDATDADGDLRDDPQEAFTLTATATFGQAKSLVAVDLAYESDAVEALSYPFPVAGGADGRGQLCTYLTGVFTPACAGGFLQAPINVLYSSTNTSWIDQPDPSLVRQYASLGTTLPLSLSVGSLGSIYQDLVLTTSVVSSGASRDSQHIYVIDGQDGGVVINDLVLVGTLVAVNTTTLVINDPLVMRPGPAGLPVVITDADLHVVNASPRQMDETWPDTDDIPGEPDFDDPTRDGVQGIIYVDGDLTIDHDMDMWGSIIATGRATINDDVVIRHDSIYTRNPPPGFRVVDSLSAVTGSWRSVME
ncbi:MAG: hypothetical protein AAFS11_08360, partial [Planctomycetota bacterium]